MCYMGGRNIPRVFFQCHLYAIRLAVNAHSAIASMHKNILVHSIFDTSLAVLAF